MPMPKGEAQRRRDTTSCATASRSLLIWTTTHMRAKEQCGVTMYKHTPCATAPRPPHFVFLLSLSLSGHPPCVACVGTLKAHQNPRASERAHASVVL